MLLTSPVALLFSLVLGMSASAAPVIFNSGQLSKRDVWAPKITDPSDGTVWHVGSEATVTWGTSSRPAEVTNPIGTLLLGHLEPDGSGGENLDTDHPLAKGFSLDDGSVTFTVPEATTPNNNYIVALIGDSGNISPKFTISN